MSYQVRYTPHAAKQLADLPARAQARILARGDDLGTAPRGSGVIKLEDGGQPAVYRARVGQYRLLFTVDDARQLVEVVAVGPRNDVYRRR